MFALQGWLKGAASSIRHSNLSLEGVSTVNAVTYYMWDRWIRATVITKVKTHLCIDLNTLHIHLAGKQNRLLSENI